MSVRVFGIPNCQTVKRARAWLQDQGVESSFHDFKKLGVPQPEFQSWLAALGTNRLVNRQGTTWRQLDDASRNAAQSDDSAAVKLLLEKPSLIKRPVVMWADGAITVGFDADDWRQRVGKG